MRILIADDDRVSSTILRHSIERLGHDVVVAHDGEQAWRMLRQDETAAIAILDWMMPGLTGLELCRLIRQGEARSHLYVMLLTARNGPADVVTAIDAGADDYLTKPFDPEELRARVQVGIRIVSLQRRLAERVAELQEALSQVKQLSGLLPICSYCKRIRSDDDYWEQIDSFVSQHSEAEFSHGVCPSCFETARAEFEA
jgi:sigma-B regulation protein RsbU (phosphoserine phosphatase)